MSGHWIDTRKIQVLLGHKSLSSTQVYTHMTSEEASEKGECANCGKTLGGNQIYYCGEDCKSEFYSAHPTSVRWNDLRLQALARDRSICAKCGKPAEEVDHIREIREGGPEFDLENLQSLCHDCHVLKTNENRRRRDGIKEEQ